MNKTLQIAMAVVLTLGASACSFRRGVETRSEEVLRAATANVDTLRNASLPSAVTVHDKGFWVSTREVPLKRGTVDVSCNITLMQTSPLSLFELGSRIESICGIPVDVDVSQPVKQANGSQSDHESGREAQSLPTLLSRPDAQRAMGASVPMLAELKWSGALSGLLGQVTSQTGTHWEATGGRIRIFKFATKVFRIYALPGTEALSTSMGTAGSLSSGSASSGGGGGMSGGGMSGGASGGSMGGGTVGTSTQNVQISVKQSIMSDVEKAVTGMLSRDGSMVLSPSTASVAVTDTPAVLARVRDYVEQQNRILTTQVVLNVKILSVTFDRADQYAIDWNKLAYASSRFGLSLASQAALEQNTKARHGEVQILRGPFKDTKLLVDALSTQGKVSVVTQPSVTTLNLQAVPMQVATQTAYAAAVTNTVTPQVGTSTGITPGTVTTGFNMLLLPYAMPDGRVLLKYDIGISNLKHIDKFGDAARGQVQLPTVDQWAFSQKVRLRSGETLVLSGYDQDQNSTDDSGTFVPQNILMGGSNAAQRRHTVIVILINPVVIS